MKQTWRDQVSWIAKEWWGLPQPLYVPSKLVQHFRNWEFAFVNALMTLLNTHFWTQGGDMERDAALLRSKAAMGMGWLEQGGVLWTAVVLGARGMSTWIQVADAKGQASSCGGGRCRKCSYPESVTNLEATSWQLPALFWKALFLASTIGTKHTLLLAWPPSCTSISFLFHFSRPGPYVVLGTDPLIPPFVKLQLPWPSPRRNWITLLVVTELCHIAALLNINKVLR